ncbi:MAG: hypothetical protein KF791_12585 [Verrucomicrobiae bacterium]|nr:hypothetical protein [Verrucomicrobiae bacterium]
MNGVPASDSMLRHGSDDPLPERRELRAGPVSMVFEAGDLRTLRRNGREVLRRIYGAVRDANWGTVPGVISHLVVDDSGDGFVVGYTQVHQRGPVHFAWQATITGDAAGTVRFVLDGEARATFLRNRIGLCVLHPIRECAGTPCRALYGNGTGQQMRFPGIIAAEQPVRWLHDLAGLAHEVSPGLWAEVRFAGDAFETEDQRNWIDASFKTYGTPLRLPFPMEIREGTRVRQEVVLRWHGPEAPTPASRPTIVISEAPRVPVLRVRRPPAPLRLPRIGLGAATHGRILTEEQARRLQFLHPAHLRVDLRVWERRWQDRLFLVASEAADLGAQLEVVLHLNENPGQDLRSVAAHLGGFRDVIARLLVLHRGRRSTTPTALAAARRHLGKALPDVPLGAGTDGDLYQINLSRPPADADFICWSMNPQVHAADTSSVAETPPAAGQQVSSVAAYFPGRPLYVSPVSLRPRGNPNATGPEAPQAAGELPSAVDPRQLSLFGAAWTLAMVKALAEAGAAGATFYETTGWQGVLETSAGSPLPARFPSGAGGVFPLFHVLADLGACVDGRVLEVCGDPGEGLAALAVATGERTAVWVANLGRETRQLKLDGISGGGMWRRLDASTVRSAVNAPEPFRQAPGERWTPGMPVGLPPFATLRLLLDPGTILPDAPAQAA